MEAEYCKIEEELAFESRVYCERSLAHTIAGQHLEAIADADQALQLLTKLDRKVMAVKRYREAIERLMKENTKWAFGLKPILNTKIGKI